MLFADRAPLRPEDAEFAEIDGQRGEGVFVLRNDSGEKFRAPSTDVGSALENGSVGVLCVETENRTRCVDERAEQQVGVDGADKPFGTGLRERRLFAGHVSPATR